MFMLSFYLMAIWPAHQYSVDLFDPKRCAANLFARRHSIRVNASFLGANIFPLMISKCNFPKDERIQQKIESIWCSCRVQKKLINTYLWCPMRLCWWIGPCLTFRTRFPNFLRKHLANICRRFWFLHVNNVVCVFLFMSENWIFSPATCLASKKNSKSFHFNRSFVHQSFSNRAFHVHLKLVNHLDKTKCISKRALS